MIKSRYFPNCDFLLAPKSARASWAWSSLLAGRDLILRGARWQILDGSRVHLWTDKWLPCVANPILRPTDGSTRDDTLMVSTISNPISMQWNLSSICDAISDRDLEIFLTLPLGDGSESDRVIWPLNRNGDYSVKSGYHLIHSGDSSNVHLRPSSLHAPTNVLRKVIWNSSLIPKLKKLLVERSLGLLGFEGEFVQVASW